MKVKIKKNISLMKMLKALDNHIRLLIVEHMLNSPPLSRTYIHKLVEEARGETSKGTTSYHLDVLMVGGVIEEDQKNEYMLYHVTPEAMKTLEHYDLIRKMNVETDKPHVQTKANKMDWRDKLELPQNSIESLSLTLEIPIEIIEQMEKQKVTGTVISGCESLLGQVIWFEIQFEDFALATTLDCDEGRHSMKFLVRRKDWENIGVSTKGR